MMIPQAPKYELCTRFVSEIESDDRTDFSHARAVMDELSIPETAYTTFDLWAVRYICECVSTRAADLIWLYAHPTGPLLTSWDLFHRAGVADLRAVRRQGLAVEVIDIHKAMGALFGVGRGRVLLRAVAFELADAISVPSRAPVTREGVHAERNAAELVKNYRVYHTAMKAKMELAREGSGARSLTSLVDIGRRLSAVDFVVFLTIFRDGNTSCVRPLNTLAQRA